MSETGSMTIDACNSIVNRGKKDAVSKQNGRKYKIKTMEQRQKVVTKHDCSVPRPPALQISKAAMTQRQRTMTLLSYNRKSLSQVDLKEALRTGNTPRINPDNAANAIVSKDQSVDSANDPLIAGMRIYTIVLLNAWRKRGDVIKDLSAQLERFKQNSLNLKNQLHLLKALFTDEKGRTNELSEELRAAREHIQTLQLNEAELRSQHAAIERKCMNVEEQLLLKSQDHHAVNVYFKQTKNELYKLMSDNQDVQVQLKLQQQKVAELENERLKLLKSIELISTDARHVEEKLQSNLAQKNNELTDLSLKFQNLQAELQELHYKQKFELNKFSSEELKLRNELETVQSEAEVLRHCLAGTIGQRMRDCWNASVVLQRTSFGFVHWFAAIVLPALPPPSEGAPGIPIIQNPFGFFTIEKAMNLIKR